jgi:hypothetical protein
MMFRLYNVASADPFRSKLEVSLLALVCTKLCAKGHALCIAAYAGNSANTKRARFRLQQKL